MSAIPDHVTAILDQLDIMPWQRTILEVTFTVPQPLEIIFNYPVAWGREATVFWLGSLDED